MINVKEKMTEVIRSQPEDASYEEIMRELAFDRMIQRGLDDSRKGKVISNGDMGSRIKSWRKLGGLKKRIIFRLVRIHLLMPIL